MHESDSGFTLVETVVGLVIVAAALITFYESFSSGWRGYRLAEEEAALVEFAQSRLAAAGTETPLVEGQQQYRTEDGLTWTIDVRPYGQPQEKNPPSALDGFWVTVEVSGRKGPFDPVRQVALTTLKLQHQP